MSPRATKLESGALHPHAGARPPVFAAAFGLAVALGALAGCGSDPDHKTLAPIALGMTSKDAPFYSDGEATIYQVKRAVPLPITKPADDLLVELKADKVAPYGRRPSIVTGDVRFQISWTLSNLDDVPQDVEILIDPWNEIVRYWPGLNISDEETVPDLSGVDLLVRVDPKSRLNSIFTFEDTDELGIDLATAENLIVVWAKKLAAQAAAAGSTDATGATVNSLVNHAFERHNRSSDGDILSRPYIPAVTAGLVGFDLGLRTSAPANVAIEIVIEVVDQVGDRVQADGNVDATTIVEPTHLLTAPSASP